MTESLDGRPFWDLISIECSDGDSSGDLGTLSADRLFDRNTQLLVRQDSLKLAL